MFPTARNDQRELHFDRQCSHNETCLFCNTSLEVICSPLPFLYEHMISSTLARVFGSLHLLLSLVSVCIVDKLWIFSCQRGIVVLGL